MWIADSGCGYKLFSVLLFRSSLGDFPGVQSQYGCGRCMDRSDECHHVTVCGVHDHCVENELEKTSRKSW